MILQNKREEEEIIGSASVIEANINTNDLPIILNILSTNFYSDPIGSLVRETASNSYDANIEAGIDDPILVKILYDAENNNYYVEFTDYGLGISEDRMNKVFMSWGTSTKRGDNLQLGGYGLGSKSPLSYNDYFYITTRNEGTEYKYILSKGDPLPTLLLLNKKEDCTERNGTTIRVDIKEGDLGTFHNAIKTQLNYFENIWVESVHGYPVNNNFKIYNAETFKVRSDRTEAGPLHIAIKSVRYPIDFNALGVKSINLPFALKFDVGELSITPNRENIQYTKDTKEILLKRIEQFKEEVIKIFNKQNKEIETFEEYLERISNQTRYLKIGEKQWNIQELGVVTEVIYKPLEGLKLTYYSLFEEWSFFLVENGILKEDYSLDPRMALRNKNLYILREGEMFNKYTNAFIGNGVVAVYRKRRFKSTTEVILPPYQIKTRNVQHNTIRYKSLLPLGTSKKVNAYRKEVRNYIVSKSKGYYTKMDDDWIKEFNRRFYAEQKERLRQRKLDRKVIVYDVQGRRYEVKLDYLNKFKYVVVNIYDKDEKENKYLTLIRDILNYANLNKDSKYKFCYILQISKTSYRELSDLNNLVLPSQFLSIKEIRHQLNRLYFAYRLSHEFPYSEVLNRLKSKSVYYSEIAREVENFIIKYNRSNIIHHIGELGLTNRLKALYNKKDPRLYKIREQFKELKKATDTLNDIQYIVWGAPKRIYRNFLFNKKVTKLNAEYYGNHFETSRTESDSAN